MGNKAITLYQAPGRRGVKSAEGFTRAITIEPGDTAALAAAVSYDNTLAEYEGAYRTGDKFKAANVVMADNDNTHSDDPADWIKPADVQAAFPGAMLYQYPSRNNMKPKDGRTPRPKFHNLFGIEPTADKAAFTGYMTALIERFPQLHFDKEVKSAAQLNFGVEGAEVTFTDGEMTLTEFLQANGGARQSNGDTAITNTQDAAPPFIPGIIPAGKRETAMFDEATRIITRYGDTPESRAIYSEFIKRLEVIPNEADPPQHKAEYVWARAQKHYRDKTAKRPGYTDPKDFNAAAQEDFSLKPADLTDVGESLILAREYGDRLKHSPATNYLVYSGQLWEENAARARGMLHDLTERQLEENTPLYYAATRAMEKAEQAVAAAKQGGSDADKKSAATAHAKAKRGYAPVMAYQAFILKKRNSKEISGVLKEAQTLLEISVSALDANGFSLNTPGGEVDLRTGEITAHSPESYHTKITAAEPSDAGADIWRDFLSVITCGDKELESYTQLIAGQAAIGKVLCENLIIAYGSGRNGKSTLFNTLSRVMGDYAGQISAETLTTGRKNGKNWELAELRGKRLIVAPELEEGTRLDAAFVKKICSTDRILGEQKYKTPFTFEPSHLTVLYTNHLPRIGSSDAGTWRRLIVIPFNAVIEGKADIKNYADYLFHNAGGAALAWAIEGAKRFIKAGYHIEKPESVKQAIESYRAANDWLSNFLSECCEVDPKFREKSGELYREYRAYCERTGEYIRSAQDFKAAIEGAGYETRRQAAGVFYYGLRVQSDFLKGA